jgi:hypothetical protein
LLQIVYRVVLAALWLVIGVGLLFFRELMPPQMADRSSVIVNMMGLVALLLVAYNVMRLVAYLRRRAARARLDANPLRPAPGSDADPAPPRPRQYIPELDFTRRDPPAEQANEPRPPESGVRNHEGTTGNSQG